MPIQQTPLSPLPFQSYTLSIPVGLVVEANPAPFSNTKEILILNTSQNTAIQAKIAVVNPVFPVAPLTNAIVIPAGTAVTLAIGPEGYRNPLARSVFWAAFAGSNLNLVFDAPGAQAPIDVNVTYVQSPGGGGGVTP